MTVVTIDVNEYLERIETNMSSYTCSIQNTKIRNLKTETYGYQIEFQTQELSITTFLWL